MSSLFSKQPEPILINNINRVKLKSSILPQLHELNLRTTLDTTVVCRVCRGERIVYVRSRATGILNVSYCFNCKGSGEMSNRVL